MLVVFPSSSFVSFVKTIMLLEMATTDTNGIDCIRKAKLRCSFPCNLHLVLVVI